MATRALRQAVPAVVGTVAAFAGWFYTTRPLDGTSSLPHNTPSTDIASATDLTPSFPVEVCWARNDTNIDTSLFSSRPDTVLHSSPQYHDIILPGLAIFLVLLILSLATFFALAVARKVERATSKYIPRTWQNVASATYHTYQNYTTFTSVALLALQLGSSQLELPPWAHFAALLGSLLYTLCQADWTVYNDAPELQDESTYEKLQRVTANLHMASSQLAQEAASSAQLLNTIKQLTTRFEELEAQQKQQSTGLAGRIAELEKEKAQQEELKNQSYSRILELEKQQTHRETMLSELDIKYHQENSAKTELEQHLASVDKAHQIAAADYQRKIDILNTRKSEIQDRFATSEGDHLKTPTEDQRLTQAHSREKQQSDQRLALAEKAHQTAIAGLQRSIDTLKTDRSALQTRLEESEKEHRQTVTDNERLIEAHNSKQQEAERHLASTEQAHKKAIAEHQGSINALTNDTLALQTRLEASRNDHFKTITEAQQLKDADVIEKQKLEQRISDAKVSVESLSQAKVDAQESLKASQDTVATLVTYGQSLIRTMLSMNTRHQNHIEALEQAYCKDMFEARIEHRIVVQAIFQHMSHQASRKDNPRAVDVDKIEVLPDDIGVVVATTQQPAELDPSDDSFGFMSLAKHFKAHTANALTPRAMRQQRFQDRSTRAFRKDLRM